MPCTDYNSTADALSNFTGEAPLDAITCTYSADWGLGMGSAFLMFVIGFMGLGLTVRARHPGPVVIAGMLSAGVLAASLPGIVAKIFALVIFIGFTAAGLYVYQRAQSSL